jgi:hypothetical protein
VPAPRAELVSAYGPDADPHFLALLDHLANQGEPDPE